MKNCALTLAFLSVLSAAGVALAVPRPAVSDSDVLIELSATSATLSGFGPNPTQNDVNALLRLYAINSAMTPSLPVDPTSMSTTIFALYTTLAETNQTATPIFDDSFAVPSPLFTPQTYLVVELWNMTQSSSSPQPAYPMYLGGIALTVSQVQLLPHNDSLVLSGQSNQPVGLVNLSWQ